MYLETERLLLRDFTMDDLDALHQIFGDPDVMTFVEPCYSREKTEAFLRDFCVEREPKGAFAAVERATGKLVGYVLFKSIDEPEIYELGWIFNKLYWRRGYAHEICAELIKYGFSEMKLHKICAEAIDGVKSVGLMKKLGMTQEGIQRKHTKPQDGLWCDLYWYAVLEEDFS